jgi:Tfp pilus assembly protein PilZ
MINRRKNKRVALHAVIKYGLEKPPTLMCLSADLSETGVCIQANRIFNPGIKLYLTISINNRSFDAEGVVAWAQAPSSGIITSGKSGMGIEFTSVEKGLLDICKAKS